jgi:hypothetical protein
MRDNARRLVKDESTRVGQRTLAIAVIGVASAIIGSTSPALAGPDLASPSISAHHHHPHHHHHHHAGRHHHHHHHAGRHHHKGAHLKRVTVDGLVTAVHQRHVTVFASSSTIGRRTTHDTVVHFLLGRHAHRDRHLQKGYVLHLVASGHGSMKHLVIPKVKNVHVAPSPAAVTVGVVDQVSSNGLVVSQFSRDDGDHGRDGAQHRLSVDTSTAKVTVDGGAGTIRRGDLVALLGEADGSNVLASRVFGFSGEAESLRGEVKAIDGDAVTIRSEGYDTTISLGSGANDVPLFLDGAAAATDQLRVHDRIVVLGVVRSEEEGFEPLVGFAFDGHDNGPCGDNPLPRHHRH